MSAALQRSSGTTRASFPFIVACGRSGTTLLRAILDSHPDVAVPPETRFILSLLKRRRRYESRSGFVADRFVRDLRWFFGLRELELNEGMARAALEPAPEDTPDAIRRVFAAYARDRGKTRYGNKTPVHILSIPALASAFPEARFVHIIRDGRDVALSYLDADIGPDTIEGAALRWRRWVTRGRDAGRRLGPERYLEVRYERLVEDPERATRAICSFLDLRFDPAMLRYTDRVDEVLGGIRRPDRFGALHLPPTKGLRDWRRQMNERDQAAFAVLAGGLLADLGYDVSMEAIGTKDRARARWGAVRADSRRAGDALFRAVVVPFRRRARRPGRLAASER